MAQADMSGLYAGQQYMSQMSSFNNFSTQQSAQRMQEMSSTQNQLAQIGAQTRSEKQKTAAQIHQIQQETQTKIGEMHRETYINKSKSSNKIHDKMVQLMMS